MRIPTDPSAIVNFSLSMRIPAGPSVIVSTGMPRSRPGKPGPSFSRSISTFSSRVICASRRAARSSGDSDVFNHGLSCAEAGEPVLVLSMLFHPFLSQCSHSRGRILPSGSRQKLLQDERGCSHRHGALTKLAEIDPRQGEWLLESIALDEMAKLWENVLADLQTGPSTQEDELILPELRHFVERYALKQPLSL